MAKSNMIEFNRLECLTAEAIFGDMVEVVFAGQSIGRQKSETGILIRRPGNHFQFMNTGFIGRRLGIAVAYPRKNGLIYLNF